MSAFSKLFSDNGTYSLHYLIHLYGSYKSSGETKTIEMWFINDTQSCSFKGNEYEAEAFNYTPNASEYGLSGGGTLEISVVGNQVIELVELCRSITLEIVGCMLDDGSITELKHFRHKNGTIKVNRNTATFNFNRDERLDMTFPALIWNTRNNRGNS